MPKSAAADTGRLCIHDRDFRAVYWQSEREPMAFMPSAYVEDLLEAGLVLPARVPFDAYCFHPALSAGSQLEADFQALAFRWYREGRLPAWREECFDLYAPGSTKPKFKLERVAARHLGFWTEAVHVNGLLADDDMMWLARRSMAKDTDPGMLDNMVAGGLSAGESIEACLWRECWEEAGLDPDMQQQIIDKQGLKPLRLLHIQCFEALATAWPYIRRERLYAFSLRLPKGFVPANQDGEVSAYICVDRKGLKQRIDEAVLTQDAALVASLWL